MGRRYVNGSLEMGPEWKIICFPYKLSFMAPSSKHFHSGWPYDPYCGCHCLSSTIPVHAHWTHEHSGHNIRNSIFPPTEVFIWLLRLWCTKYSIKREQWWAPDIAVYWREPTSHPGAGEPVHYIKGTVHPGTDSYYANWLKLLNRSIEN